MFSDIDTRRHWPATGMTSEKWLSVYPKVVKIKDLIATQDGVYLEPIIRRTPPVGGDQYPHIIIWQGKLYLEDGHHRVVRRAMKGCSDVTARVLDLDNGIT